MDLAVHLANYTLPDAPGSLAGHLAGAARAADEGGVATLTVMDHWFQMESDTADAAEPMLEGYTTLGYLAALTHRIELGLLVTGVTYRHPALLAKIVTTLDVLSGGRALLGIGAAWYEREHLALGVPFPPVATRFGQLEEALQICRQMWSEDDGPFDGEHFQLAETLCSPQPIRRPRILIGGMGERKTLRFVARYADACNLFDIGADGIAHKLGVLDQHCETEGRDPGDIERTVVTATDPVSDPDGFLATMETYAGLGITKVWVGPGRDVHLGDNPAAWVTTAVEAVLPRLSQL